jgi:hypothetical protein
MAARTHPSTGGIFSAMVELPEVVVVVGGFSGEPIRHDVVVGVVLFTKYVPASVVCSS